jgi:hypothetical protein
MARGWESKSVDLQIEAREKSVPLPPGNKIADSGKKREIEVLELSRKRLLQEIETARDLRLKQLKKRALSFIERRISELNAIVR